MQLSDILLPEHVFVRLPAPSKGQVLQSLCKAAAAALGRDDAGIQERIAARERLGSTGIGGGIALPHTAVPGLDRPFGMLALLDRPVDFGAIDDMPVDLVFLLLSPHPAAQHHLSALACAARQLRSPGALSAMRAAADEKTLYEAATA